MSGSVLPSWPTPPQEPFEEALEVLLDGWRETKKCSQPDRALILALAAKISPARRAYILRDFERALATPSSRGGPVFNRVIQFIDRQPDWTARTISDRLAQQGQPVDAKTLSNCLNYLVNSGRFVRISRGRYAVAGSGVVTSDKLLPSHDIQKGGENED